MSLFSLFHLNRLYLYRLTDGLVPRQSGCCPFHCVENRAVCKQCCRFLSCVPTLTTGRKFWVPTEERDGRSVIKVISLADVGFNYLLIY